MLVGSGKASGAQRRSVSRFERGRQRHRQVAHKKRLECSVVAFYALTAAVVANAKWYKKGSGAQRRSVLRFERGCRCNRRLAQKGTGVQRRRV